MIDTLVIVVYNRLENVDKWFSALEQIPLNKRPENLVIIHNIDGPPGVCTYEYPFNLFYIHRKNIGFDIGAFQDVCKNRLPGFPDWQQLLWCTDDTFPMVENFLDYFALKEGEGVRAMTISHYVREHVRTTGFSITRAVAERLRFPADPIKTKQECYLFEHRWFKNTLIDQVRKMNLKVVEVAPPETSPMFDTGYHRKLPRETELAQKWGFEVPPAEQPKRSGITFICPIYNSFPAVIASLIMQTVTDWKLILIHDGPEEGHVSPFIRALNDDRITFVETEKRAGNWGHAIRAEYLQKVDTEYVIITNPDNYYVPVFLEYLLKPFTPGRPIVATYCSAMVHSYLKWQTQACALRRGHVDCGGVLLKTKEAQAVGWHSVEHSADWFFFEAIIKRYGGNSFVPVRGTLFVHN